jgi:hypothetical protein
MTFSSRESRSLSGDTRAGLGRAGAPAGLPEDTLMPPQLVQFGNGSAAGSDGVSDGRLLLHWDLTLCLHMYYIGHELSSPGQLTLRQFWDRTSQHDQR